MHLAPAGQSRSYSRTWEGSLPFPRAGKVTDFGPDQSQLTHINRLYEMNGSILKDRGLIQQLLKPMVLPQASEPFRLSMG